MEPKNRPYLLLVLTLACAAFFFQLGARDMWGRLETEAAVCARNMLETGEFTIPVVMGWTFVDNRPPGAFWLVAGAFELTGQQDEWSARLPSALASILCVLLVYMMGRRAAGPRGGLNSALILMGMVSFLWMGRMSQQDMLLTLFTTVAYWAFWRSLEARSRSSSFLHVLAFQVAVGCGALCKGPAIVLCLLPLGFYVAYARRWRDVKWAMLLLTLPVGLVLGGAWYLQIWVQYPHLREMLVTKFTHQNNIHIEPSYDYLVRLPGLLGPAFFLLPFAGLAWRSADQEERRGPLGFFLIGFVAQFVIFSLFPSKRSHYLLPSLPLLALAIGTAIAQRRYEGRLFLVRLGLVLAVLPVILAAGWFVVAPMVANYLPLPLEELSYASPLRAAILTLAFAGLTAFIHLSYRNGHQQETWRYGWICWVLCLVFVLGEIAPRFNAQKSLRVFAREVGRIVPPDAKLGALSGHAGLEYYAGRSIQRMGKAGVDEYLSDPAHYLIALDDAHEAVSEERRNIVYAHEPNDRVEASFLLQGVALDLEAPSAE